MLFVYSELGYRAVNVATIPPLIWGVELGYRVVANNRIAFSKVFFRKE